LGGYKENEFEEYHYKILTVAQSMGLASKAKKSSLNTAVSKNWRIAYRRQIRDRCDDLYKVTDILDSQLKNCML
jgi:hypothetical protein